MDDLIKNKELLTKDSILNGDRCTYIIQTGKKLGDVFNYLPHGIIDKTETGIGGTTLELDAERDSIIVQPYNFTAWSKAQHKSLSHNYNLYYYGNYTFRKKINAVRVNKINILNIELTKESRANKKLIEYIEFCRNQKQPIKITCVTDQLQALKECIDNIEPEFFNSFHLVLDEIDSLQDQSSFRVVMENCYKIYKSHPKENRTVISATLIEFHDKEMMQEQYSKIEYNLQHKKNIEVVISRNLEEELVKQIISLANKNNEKILVACNHLEYSMNVIKALEKESIFKEKTFKILCSSARKSQVKEYFDYMGEDGILPGDITFYYSCLF